MTKLGPAIFAALMLVPSVASANGRFPDAMQLVTDPNDESHISVQTTYGFIHTRDAGEHWYWTCEDAASYGGVLDPPISILDGGTLIAGVFDGLVVSSPDECNYALVGGDLVDRFILDVSRIKSDTSHAIALSSDGLGSNQFDTRVWATENSGDTWAQLGASLPADFLGFTLDAAPDDPNILYLSGFTVVSSSEYVGSLAISIDAGETWEVKPIEGSANDSGPYIAAIDPNDHDTIYVRLASLEGKLLVTHDAGDTWEDVFTGEGLLLGFALSPDGSELRLGGDVDGLWKASTDDLPASFEKMSGLGVRCLTWTDDALYACGREAFDHFTVGKSTDGGDNFVAIHNLQCLDGLDPDCDADSTIQTLCPGPWAAQKQVLQTDQCPTGAGGSGEGGAGAGGGGANATGGDGPGGGGGCSSCGIGSRSGHGTLAVAGLLLAFVGLRRRRTS